MSAKPVEHESKTSKKSTAAPPAEAEKPEKSPSEAPGSLAPAQEAKPEQKLLSIKDIIANVDPKMMKTASTLTGGLIEPLMKWAYQQEQITFKLVEANDKIVEGLKPLMTAIQERNKTPLAVPGAPAAPGSVGGGALEKILDVASSLMGSGTQPQNPVYDEFMKKVMDRALNAIDRGSKTDDAIYAAITSRLAGKVASEVVP